MNIKFFIFFLLSYLILLFIAACKTEFAKHILTVVVFVKTCLMTFFWIQYHIIFTTPFSYKVKYFWSIVFIGSKLYSALKRFLLSVQLSKNVWVRNSHVLPKIFKSFRSYRNTLILHFNNLILTDCLRVCYFIIWVSFKDFIGSTLSLDKHFTSAHMHFCLNNHDIELQPCLKNGSDFIRK